MSKESKAIIGRQKELATLDTILNSDKAEFLALYGRRRIGKTFLIREFFSRKNCFFLHVTGKKDGTLSQQLDKLIQAVEKTFYDDTTQLKKPSNWTDAFNLLNAAVKQFAGRKKVVLFFDEAPWLATPRSDFLQTIDDIWNTNWTYNPKIKLILCGSAASWIIKKIIKNKGGLHNRLTEIIRLNPFTLNETRSLLQHKNIHLNERSITDIYMTTGGVPHYLDRIKKGFSAVQIIDQLCFTKDGLLFNEFENLFSSLFDHAEAHYELIQLIAKNRYGISKKKLAKQSKLSSSGGRLNERIQELIEAGFVMPIMPYGHKQKGEYYRISDEYTYFYLSWIDPIKKTFRAADQTSGYWLEKTQSSAWKSWAGYTFESVCYKHIHCIRKALDITAGAEVGAWRYAPLKQSNETGTQVDLLFDRTDGAVTLCEIKYSRQPFSVDKNYYQTLIKKIDTYKKASKTNKQIFLALISAAGLKKNEYSGIFSHTVTIEDLFS